jgi:hypothetical protein
MADRNMEQRRANYKAKSQFNAADVRVWVFSVLVVDFSEGGNFCKREERRVEDDSAAWSRRLGVQNRRER